MTPQHEWVSVHEASRRLNRSVATVRRMIEAGKLEAEREVIGGSRERYRVRMPQEASGAASLSESSDASTSLTNAPAAITGLLEIVAADRETIARQAETIGELRERVGRAEARAEMLTAERDDLAERLRAAEERLAQKPWYRRWW